MCNSYQIVCFRCNQNKWIGYKGDNFLCGKASRVLDVYQPKYQIQEWISHKGDYLLCIQSIVLAASEMT
jgi:hypothetical protein